MKCTLTWLLYEFVVDSYLMLCTHKARGGAIRGPRPFSFGSSTHFCARICFINLWLSFGHTGAKMDEAVQISLCLCGWSTTFSWPALFFFFGTDQLIQTLQATTTTARCCTRSQRVNLCFHPRQHIHTLLEKGYIFYSSNYERHFSNRSTL